MSTPTASPARSDTSASDGDELSFYYTTDDHGQFVRRSKTPTATTPVLATSATLLSAPSSANSSPLSVLSDGSPAPSPVVVKPAGLTRGRSESAVVLPSAGSIVGNVRPFSRVASATASATTTSAGGRFTHLNYPDMQSSAREKENRHPRTCASSRTARFLTATTMATVDNYTATSRASALRSTPAATMLGTSYSRAPSRALKRVDDDDAPLPERESTPDDLAATTARPPSALSMNISSRRRDEPPQYSSAGLTRTPSATITTFRPRIGGPKRVTQAEKVKQEEDVRRELAEFDRQRKRDEDEQRLREEEEARRRAAEEELARRRADEARRAEEEIARRRAAEEDSARRRAAEEDSARRRAAEDDAARRRPQQVQEEPDDAVVEQQQDGWYGTHRRRESETAMPPAPPGLQVVHNARLSPSAKNVRAVEFPSQPSVPRHKRSPTAPEPRAGVMRTDVPERAARTETVHQVSVAEPVERRREEVVTVNKKLYRKLNLLGKGGTSRVYMVTGERNEVFALKRVGLENADDQTVQGYLNEIQLLRRLDGNKRIIRLFDSEVQVVSNKRVLFMVMECGETDLAKLILERQSEPLEMDWVRYHWRQMLQAVQVIHDEKIVHSDLKPANFVLVKGCVKLIDFGIANAIANDTTNIQRDHQIGTVNFMSPEALEVAPDGLRRFKVGRASDVWSLGCILYQMIYGHPPFASLSVYHKMKAIPDPNYPIDFPIESVPTIKSSSSGPASPPRRLEEFARLVPRDVIATMKYCLVRNPKERATIPDLLRDQFLTFQPPVRPPSPPVPRPETNERMAYVNDYYMRQCVSWVVSKCRFQLQVMSEPHAFPVPIPPSEDVLFHPEGAAELLIDELRRVYTTDPALMATVAAAIAQDVPSGQTQDQSQNHVQNHNQNYSQSHHHNQNHNPYAGRGGGAS